MPHNNKKAVDKYRERHHVVSLHKETVEVLAKVFPHATSVDAAVREALGIPQVSALRGSVLLRYRQKAKK